jgi:hypothetical protein
VKRVARQGKAGRRVSRKIMEDLDGAMLEQLRINEDSRNRVHVRPQNASFDVVYENFDNISDQD